MSVVVDVLKEIFLSNRDRHAIPSLDGTWRPNHRLDEAGEVGAFEAPDDVVVHDGELVVSSAAGVFGLDGSEPSARTEPSARREVSRERGAGALASRGDKLAIGVEGKGVLVGDRLLVETDGPPLVHPTALAFVDDETLLVTEGSADEPPSRWVWDSMKKGRSGRLVRFDLSTGKGTTLAWRLAYPNGVVVRPRGDTALVTEAWSHRLLSMSVSRTGAPKVLVPNYPGYPARIKPAAAGGYWLTFFSMRTQLVDFVLEEDEYRTAMLETVDPAWWIAPTLAVKEHFLEPCQGGQIKQLGILKAWAPPRSYGLVVRLDEELDAVESLHSRVGGKHHGITAAVEHEGSLFAVSKGNGKLIEVRR